MYPGSVEVCLPDISQMGSGLDVTGAGEVGSRRV